MRDHEASGTGGVPVTKKIHAQTEWGKTAGQADEQPRIVPVTKIMLKEMVGNKWARRRTTQKDKGMTAFE